MELSQATIARLYLAAWILGAALGSFYDLLRFPRAVLFRDPNREGDPSAGPLRKRRAVTIAVFLEDFLFCLVAAVGMILLFYEVNNGKIRPFAFLAAFGGFLLYRATLGRLVRRAIRWVARVIRRTVRAVLKAVVRPCRICAERIGWAGRKAAVFLREKRERRARAHCTRRLFATVGTHAAGLLPDGERLKKTKDLKNTAQAGKGKRKKDGGKTHDKDHRAEQESLA